MRVTIRPAIYRGVSGYTVSWKRSKNEFTQHVFVKTLHTASRIKWLAKVEDPTLGDAERMNAIDDAVRSESSP